MSRIVIQMGHVPLTTGATGTHREQEFVKMVGPKLRDRLNGLGHTVHLIDSVYPAPYPSSDVFIALHTDGNNNRSVKGGSVGYPSDDPNSDSGRLAQSWKKWHQRHGYSSGFHGDNYTRDLRFYYGFRSCNARFKFLAEHGTTTNPEDEAWLFSNIDACVSAHVDAIGEIVGHPSGHSSNPSPSGQNGSTGAIVVNGANRAQGGYALVGPDGGVFCEDGAPFFGSLPGLNIKPNDPVVALAWTLDGGGYWMVDSGGGVYGFGSAQVPGSYHSLDASVRNDPNRKFVTIVATPSGGYKIISSAREAYEF